MKVFLVCPIGSENSAERQRSDKLLKYVITPAVKNALDLEVDDIVRADQMGEPGRITMQVLREVTSADIVIADVTGVNANVMYEIGIRQAMMRPFILMAEKGQSLPFDLTDLRTIFYALDLDHFEQAQTELVAHLQRAKSDPISAIDKALFSRPNDSEPQQQSVQSAENLLAVLEVCQNILRETQETKELVLAVGNVAVEIHEKADVQQKAEQEKAQQEMSKWLVSQLFENPDGAAKVLPAIQAMMELGNATGKTNLPQEPEVEPTINRAARRRQQKMEKPI